MVSKMTIGNTTYHPIYGRIYSRFYGKSFLLLYHLNATTEDFFANQAEALKSNKPDKYSIIGELDDSYKINGKFEFLLWYPHFQNHWLQSSNPVNEHETNGGSQTAEGYLGLDIGSSSNYWGGLVASSSTGQTLLDGSTYNTGWYYCIGPITYTNGRTFPAATIDDGIEAALWVRAAAPRTCKKRNTRFHAEAYVRE